MKPLTILLAVGLVVLATDSSEARRWRPRPDLPHYHVPAASPMPQEASRLIDFVRSQQQRFVRASFDERNCFTWDHLEALKSRIASGEVAAAVKGDPDFPPIVESLKQIGPAQRESAYNAAMRIRRKTWREMGFIDPAGRGQTEAGAQGDLLVGREVVRLVREAVGG